MSETDYLFCSQTSIDQNGNSSLTADNRWRPISHPTKQIYPELE